MHLADWRGRFGNKVVKLEDRVVIDVSHLRGQPGEIFLTMAKGGVGKMDRRCKLLSACGGGAWGPVAQLDRAQPCEG